MSVAKKLSLLQYSQDLLRWRKQCLVCFLLIFTLLSLSIALRKQTFTSTAKIVVMPSSLEGVLLTPSSIDRSIVPVTLENINTELELISSNDVVSAVAGEIFQTECANQSISTVTKTTWLHSVKSIFGSHVRPQIDSSKTFTQLTRSIKRSLSAKPVAVSHVITVSFTDNSPRKAHLVLQTILEKYIHHHNRVFSQVTGADFLQKQSDKITRKIDTSENAISRFSSKNELFNIELQNKNNLELMSELTKEISGLEIRSSELQSKTAFLDSILKLRDDDLIITVDIQMITSIAELQKTLIPLLVKRNEIRKNYTIESREFKSSETQVASIYSDMRNEIRKTIVMYKSEISTTLKKKAYLSLTLDKIRNTTIILNEKWSELKNLERINTVQEEKFKLLASKNEDAQLYSDRIKSNISNVSIAEYPQIPLQSNKPGKTVLTFNAFLFSLLVALLFPLALRSVLGFLKLSYTANG
ncbi:hypothetical protein JW979_15285 [bacterium]|nr:hypothetical protein [candidate division CSSED10-310 bacterium]